MNIQQLGREGLFDDTRLEAFAEWQRKLKNNDIEIQKNKQAFYQKIEEENYNN